MKRTSALLKSPMTCSEGELNAVAFWFERNIRPLLPNFKMQNRMAEEREAFLAF
jgi:hypothetical protein